MGTSSVTWEVVTRTVTLPPASRGEPGCPSATGKKRGQHPDILPRSVSPGARHEEYRHVTESRETPSPPQCPPTAVPAHGVRARGQLRHPRRECRQAGWGQPLLLGEVLCSIPQDAHSLPSRPVAPAGAAVALSGLRQASPGNGRKARPGVRLSRGRVQAARVTRRRRRLGRAWGPRPGGLGRGAEGAGPAACAWLPSGVAAPGPGGCGH